MYRHSFVFSLTLSSLFYGSVAVLAQDTPRAYPIKLERDNVRELDKLTIEANGLSLSAKDVIVVPIQCELGITGAMILGTGEFRFAPADADEIKGTFRGAMLRFDPADQPKLMPLEKSKVVDDLAAYEMSRHLLDKVFRHCWHSGMDALIPDSGSFVADVYSKSHGIVLFSTGPKSTVAHNFTTGETIYKSK